MPTQVVAKKDTAREEAALAVERVIIHNDLSKVSPEDRVKFYLQTCEAAGFDPRMQPFMFLYTNGKMSLYATRNATDQARQKLGITLEIVSREYLQEAQAYIVTARATTKDGRTDESIGAVPMAQGLRGEQYANAIMKAETKAKRRVTLSISGLSMLDETEMDTIPGARVVNIDMETGEEIPVGATVGNAAIKQAARDIPGEKSQAEPKRPDPVALKEATEQLSAAKDNIEHVVADMKAESAARKAVKADDGREPPFGFDADGNFVDEGSGEIADAKDVTPAAAAELADVAEAVLDGMSEGYRGADGDLPPLEDLSEPAPAPAARMTGLEFIEALDEMLPRYGKGWGWIANYLGVERKRSALIKWFEEGDGKHLGNPLATIEKAASDNGELPFDE